MNHSQFYSECFNFFFKEHRKIMGRKIGCEKCMKNTVVRAETALEKAICSFPSSYPG